MKSENEMIIDKLADVRDNLFDDSDYFSEDGYDLTGSYVGSPYEVLCGMEQKIIRQNKIINILESAVEDDDSTKTMYGEKIEELTSLVLWATRRLKNQCHKDFTYDSLEKIIGIKNERV